MNNLHEVEVNVGAGIQPEEVLGLVGNSVKFDNEVDAKHFVTCAKALASSLGFNIQDHTSETKSFRRITIAVPNSEPVLSAITVLEALLKLATKIRLANKQFELNLYDYVVNELIRDTLRDSLNQSGVEFTDKEVIIAGVHLNMLALNRLRYALDWSTRKQ